jgi:hypothetical protein
MLFLSLAQFDIACPVSDPWKRIPALIMFEPGLDEILANCFKNV